MIKRVTQKSPVITTAKKYRKLLQKFINKIRDAKFEKGGKNDIQKRRKEIIEQYVRESRDFWKDNLGFNKITFVMKFNKNISTIKDLSIRDIANIIQGNIVSGEKINNLPVIIEGVEKSVSDTRIPPRETLNKIILGLQKNPQSEKLNKDLDDFFISQGIDVEKIRGKQDSIINTGLRAITGLLGDRYKYLGPGTKVLDLLTQGVLPTDQLDEIAMFHDIDYTLATSKTMLDRADQRMLTRIRDLRAGSFKSLFGIEKKPSSSTIDFVTNAISANKATRLVGDESPMVSNEKRREATNRLLGRSTPPEATIAPSLENPSDEKKDDKGREQKSHPTIESSFIDFKDVEDSDEGLDEGVEGSNEGAIVASGGVDRPNKPNSDHIHGTRNLKPFLTKGFGDFLVPTKREQEANKLRFETFSFIQPGHGLGDENIIFKRNMENMDRRFSNVYLPPRESIPPEPTILSPSTRKKLKSRMFPVQQRSQTFSQAFLKSGVSTLPSGSFRVRRIMDRGSATGNRAVLPSDRVKNPLLYPNIVSGEMGRRFLV